MLSNLIYINFFDASNDPSWVLAHACKEQLIFFTPRLSPMWLYNHKVWWLETEQTNKSPQKSGGFEVPRFNFKNLCSFYVNLWEDVKIAYHSEVKKSMSTIDPMARWPRYLNETVQKRMVCPRGWTKFRLTQLITYQTRLVLQKWPLQRRAFY